MLDEKWLTIDEAKDIIGCTPSYVRFLLRNNTIEGKKISERAWIVDMRSVKKYAQNPKKTGRPRLNEKK